MSELAPLTGVPPEEFDRWNADGTERFPGINTFFPDPSEFDGIETEEPLVQAEEMDTKEQ